MPKKQPEKKDNTFVWLMVGLGLFLVANSSKKDGSPNPPTPSEPSAELQTLVKPIQEMEGNRKLAAFYLAAQGLVDATSVKTAQRLLNALHEAETTKAKLDPTLTVPGGFSAARTAAIEAQIGRASQPLTPESRAKLRDVLGAIAWALEN